MRITSAERVPKCVSIGVERSFHSQPTCRSLVGKDSRWRRHRGFLAVRGCRAGLGHRVGLRLRCCRGVPEVLGGLEVHRCLVDLVGPGVRQFRVVLVVLAVPCCLGFLAVRDLQLGRAGRGFLRVLGLRGILADRRFRVDLGRRGFLAGLMVPVVPEDQMVLEVRAVHVGTLGSC